MSDETSLDALREQAKTALAKLRGLCTDDEVRAAKELVEKLRNAKEYEAMGRLAEAVSRHDPKDAKNRRLYAQYLIDTGKATAAIDLLQPLARRLPKTHPEFAEATGLIGRAYKQIFFDAGDKTSSGARDALKQAIAAYRRPYEEDPANTWHGVNLVALLTRARRLGLRIAPDLKPREVAQRVVATLDRVPEDQRDEWYLPTLAEALLGRGDWDAVESAVARYAAAHDAQAFQVASTVRQFTEVWDLEAVDERGRGLVNILRARLMQLPGGALEVSPKTVKRLQSERTPDASQLEAVLGRNGPKTYEWMKAGLGCASSVAAVRERLGRRLGTAFLVHPGDFGVQPADELLVLTNFHVVNQNGSSPGIRPEAAEIVFEAADPNRSYGVRALVWSSPPDLHDATLLRLNEPITGIEPLRVAATLPALNDKARIYIIGHPGGRDLAFSFQDNELIDHEGPPTGRPAISGVCRVHYRAATEGGSSGSPVFDDSRWEVIALHHKGGRTGMPRLNGTEGTYAANEGIGIECIAAGVRSSMRATPPS